MSTAFRLGTSRLINRSLNSSRQLAHATHSWPPWKSSKSSKRFRSRAYTSSGSLVKHSLACIVQPADPPTASLLLMQTMRGLGNPMRGLAVLTKENGMPRTANTSRLRLLPQGLSSAAKGGRGKQVLALHVLAHFADQFPATHSMAQTIELPCRRSSTCCSSLSTCIVCMVHKP